MVKKGEELTLNIDSLAFGGSGVARFSDLVVFVAGGLPGSEVRARITKVKRSFAEAVPTAVLRESPFAAKPLCRHFGSCGGCLMQNLQYEKQLQEKSEQVRQLLRRIGGISDFQMKPPLPSPEIYDYRNKMEFSFARRRRYDDKPPEDDHEGCYLGLHARGFFDKVVDLQECRLMRPPAAEIIATVREFARRSGLAPYSTFDHRGFWRFLVIRRSVFTDDLMVNVIASEYRQEIACGLEQALAAFPEITSLYYGITRSKAAVAFCEETRLLTGKPFIVEKIGELSFRISPDSFFQTNSRQVKRLYDAVLEAAQLKESDTVYDLYCGAGTISLYVAPHVGRVVGFESVKSAVDDAVVNAAVNGIHHCRFVCADLKDALDSPEELKAAYGAPRVVILDPPRGGMHPKTVKGVIDLAPEVIVHVSCNPATLARELDEFNKNGYAVTTVQPVDMFPHTAHIETVVRLEKRKPLSAVPSS